MNETQITLSNINQVQAIEYAKNDCDIISEKSAYGIAQSIYEGKIKHVTIKG